MARGWHGCPLTDGWSRATPSIAMEQAGCELPSLLGGDHEPPPKLWVGGWEHNPLDHGEDLPPMTMSSA